MPNCAKISLLNHTHQKQCYWSELGAVYGIFCLVFFSNTRTRYSIDHKVSLFARLQTVQQITVILHSLLRNKRFHFPL